MKLQVILTRECQVDRRPFGWSRLTAQRLRRPRSYSFWTMRARNYAVLSIMAFGVSGCSGHSAPAVPAPSPAALSQDQLTRQLDGEIRGVPGAFVGIYYRNLARGGDTIAIDADSIFHAASTMKIAVMIQLYREVDAGELSLSRMVIVQNQFASIVDGTPYALDPKDDSDSGLYTLAGQAVPLRELMARMIQRSSNLATNTVIALVGAARVDSTAHALGATHMRVLRGVEDGKAFAAGLNNVTSARDLAALLLAIYEHRAASAADCVDMLDVLMGQAFNTEIPAGLPPGTRVAHKTGQITGVLHDAAIVYPNDRPPYVLVVLTRGVPDEHVAQALIARISRSVYTHATG
jgi:beta-lactamase class A